MKKAIFFQLFSTCCLLMAYSVDLQAQQDSLLMKDQSDTIVLEQSRLPAFGIGINHLLLNKETLDRYASSKLSTVLSFESTFFVKNYGPNGISTLSGRGGGASHTAVLWEGFNIQSPMLGQADISLLPAVFVDYVELQYGAESALFGNSSIGGAVHLVTRLNFNNGWAFSGTLHGGSFENIGQQFKLSFSNKWYAGSIRSFHLSAKNNFPFLDVNAFGSPKPIKQQIHAQLRQWGLQQENLFRFKQHRFGLKIWYQNSRRQIPPTLLQSTSADEQKDLSLRMVAHWKWVVNQQVWKARSALFLESLHFQSNSVNSLSQVLSSITEVENKYYLNEQHQFNFGLNYSYYQAISQGYSTQPHQHRAAIFASYKINTKDQKWTNSLNLREELVDGQFIRPAVSLGSVWEFYKKMKLNAHFSYNYRLPTFNDLYWDVLGNPDLDPEYSWNSELGFSAPFQWKNYALQAKLTAFCNLVNNWILWSPNSSGLWRPSNVDQVLSRGLEFNFKFKAHIKKWRLGFGGNYAYTKTTRTQGQVSETIGKQLIYTPEHNSNLYVRLQYKSTSLVYQHAFTSERFLDNLNTDALPFFHVANVRVEQLLRFKSMSASIYAQVNNVFGANYQVVSNRAMPWQQFEIGLRINLRQKVLSQTN